MLAITAIAALFRFWDLTSVGFNNDEAVYAGQAAALAGDSTRAAFFSVFRAHPLLVQFLISIPYRFGVSEFWGRGVVAALGTLTVTSVYILGFIAYSKRTAIVASLFLALLPYHILVSRQVLLDVGVGFFYVVTMIFVVKYSKTGDPIWAYAFGVSSALAVLSKETSILIVPIVLIFLKTKHMLRAKPFLVASAAFLLTVAPYPLSLLVGGGTERAGFVVTWQLSRPPNHAWLFYPVSLFPYFDVVALLAIPGIIVCLFRRRSLDNLILLWFSITFAFFQFWPVKGFHYLVPVAPGLCLLAARFFDLPLASVSGPRTLSLVQGLKLRRIFSIFFIFLASSSLVSAYTVGVVAAQTTTPMAGLAGLPGGREMGIWIKQNVPAGTVFLTIGPTMANLVQFYGDHQAFALSVSPNPIKRNPAYTPVINPDYQIATGQIQYLVWDYYSATRSQYFSSKMMNFVDKYNGQLLHTISVDGISPDGMFIRLEVVRIYRVYGTAGK